MYMTYVILVLMYSYGVRLLEKLLLKIDKGGADGYHQRWKGNSNLSESISNW